MPETPANWQQMVANVLAAMMGAGPDATADGKAPVVPPTPTPATPAPAVAEPTPAAVKPSAREEGEGEERARYARHGLDPEQLKFFQDLAMMRQGQIFSQQAFMDALRKGQFGLEGEDLLAGLPSKRELM